jgi:hypothetical protein
MNMEQFKQIFFILTAIVTTQLFVACAAFEMADDHTPASAEDYSVAEDDTPRDRCTRNCFQSQRERDSTEEDGYAASERRSSDEYDSTDLTEVERSRLKRAIASRDVIIGMKPTHVIRSWGEPVMREAAGDHSGGHERWRYGSRYSLQGERVVIFENGRVAGWYR